MPSSVQSALEEITSQITADDLEEVDPLDGRADARLPWRAGIDVPVRNETLRFETVNVSNGGMFVCAVVLPRVGGRVQVRMRLPPEDDFVDLEGIVRHVVEPELALDAPPGFGIELAVPRPTRERWGAFIRHLARESRTKILASDVVNELNELQARLAQAGADLVKTRALTGEELTRLLEGSDVE